MSELRNSGTTFRLTLMRVTANEHKHPRRDDDEPDNRENRRKEGRKNRRTADACQLTPMKEGLLDAVAVLVTTWIALGPWIYIHGYAVSMLSQAWLRSVAVFDRVEQAGQLGVARVIFR